MTSLKYLTRSRKNLATFRELKLATLIWVNIASIKGLVPGDTKPLPEAMLTYNRAIHLEVISLEMLIKVIITTYYSDVIMSTMASQTTGVSIVYSFVCPGVHKKYQSSTSLAFVRGIHRWPVNSPHKGPVTRKMLPFDDVIMTFEINTFKTKITPTGDTGLMESMAAPWANDWH